MVDADADATFAAAAANLESDVEAMAGELPSKCLHGSGSCGCCLLACMHVPSAAGVASHCFRI